MFCAIIEKEYLGDDETGYGTVEFVLPPEDSRHRALLTAVEKLRREGVTTVSAVFKWGVVMTLDKHRYTIHVATAIGSEEPMC